MYVINISIIFWLYTWNWNIEKNVLRLKNIPCHFHYFHYFTIDDSGTSNEWPYNHFSVITIVSHIHVTNLYCFGCFGHVYVTTQLSFNDLITTNVFELCSHIKTPSCPLRASKQPYLVRKPCFVGGHIQCSLSGKSSRYRRLGEFPLENPVGIGDRGNFPRQLLHSTVSSFIHLGSTCVE